MKEEEERERWVGGDGGEGEKRRRKRRGKEGRKDGERKEEARSRMNTKG